MLDRVLRETDTTQRDIVAITCKVLPPLTPGITPQELTLDDQDREVLTRVVNLAEGAGKQVYPLVIPTNNPLYAIAHEVWVARDSTLGRAMQEELGDGEVLQVNSRHHQAAGQTATSYRVTATAPDGVIEAIERPESRFCIAVQWHPENFWRTGEFRALFEEFVKACEKG